MREQCLRYFILIIYYSAGFFMAENEEIVLFSDNSSIKKV